MDRLEQAIINHYSNLNSNVLRTYRWVDISYNAIQNNTDVLGDSRDAIYLKVIHLPSKKTRMISL